MGCHDETCAITRTAIIPGDIILSVFLNTNEWNTKTLSQQLKDYFNKKCESPINYFHISMYIDEYYWGTERMYEKGKTWREYMFCAHMKVVEELLGKDCGVDDIYYSIENELNHFDMTENDIYNLVNICLTGRIELNIGNSIGYQYSNKEEINIQRKVLKVSEEILNNHILSFKDGISSKLV